eukprot:gene15821-20037_t
MPGLIFFTAMAIVACLVSLPLLGVEIASGKAFWPTRKGWLILIYVVIGPSILSQLFFMRAIELIGPGRAGVFVNLVPVFAPVLAVAILGEQLALYHGLALALVLGNLIGSGVYLLPATLAPLGVNQLIGWVVTSAAALAMALVFARLGAMRPMAGGRYGYVQAAFGPFAGFVTAWSYWVLLWAGNGALAVAVVSALAGVVPAIGHVSGLPAVLAVGCVWVL